MSDRRLDILVAAGSVLVAFVAFSRILTAGFTADDWYFLELVHNAPNVSVAIHPLAAQTNLPVRLSLHAGQIAPDR
jgi:hypothetical protein